MTIRSLIGALMVLSLLLAGCGRSRDAAPSDPGKTSQDEGPGGSGNGGSTGNGPGQPSDPNAPEPPELPIPGLDADPSAMQAAEGCLSLAKLYGHLRGLPETTRVRQVATDFSFKPPAGETKPRELYVAYLANNSFLFTESEIAKFAAGLPQVEQETCGEGKFIGGETGSAPFTISAASPEELTFKVGASEQTVRIESVRSISVTKRTWVMDPCRGDQFQVETRSLIRWDVPETLTLRTEKVQKVFLRQALQVLVSPLTEIQQLLSATSDESHLRLKPRQLLAIAQADVSAEAKRCRVPNRGDSTTLIR